MLVQPCTAYLSTVDPDLTQPTRAISPIIISSTTQQARTIDITTSGEEADNIPDTGLPQAEIMVRLKNRTPVGDTLITKLSLLQHTGEAQGDPCVL